MPQKLKNAVVLVVTLVWAANFTAPIFVKDYEASPELNVAFMAILGLITATYVGKKDKNEPPSG